MSTEKLILFNGLDLLMKLKDGFITRYNEGFLDFGEIVDIYKYLI